MSQDFAKKSRPRAATPNRPPSRVPGWVWLFTGTVLGVFIAFLFHLSDMPDRTDTRDSTVATASEPAEPAKEPEKPRFDFYKLLKESRVPVPDLNLDRPAKEAAAAPEEYVLQVASFKGADDAEQLRAELILLNLDAQVEMAKIRNGETWHRVLVGPFESRSKLSKARSILVSNELDALVLKRAPKG